MLKTSRLLIRYGALVFSMGVLSFRLMPSAYAASGPVIDVDSGSASFVAGDNTSSTPVPIDSDLTVTDSDDSTLASATVSITGNFQPGEDVLSFTNAGASTMGNITASYDSASGILTLTSAGSSATLAQWQAALESVTYTDTAVTPNSATRTISFNVTDSNKISSNTATRTVTVADTDQTPIVTTTGGSTDYSAVSETPTTIDSGVTVSDLDNPTLASATVSISDGFESGDMLEFVNTSNITGSYNASTGVLTLTSSGATATLAQWQNALRSIQYMCSGTSPNPVTRTISFVVNDGTKGSPAATKEVTISGANANLSSLTLNEGTLVPTFSSGTTSYTTYVPYSTSSIKVTPTVADNTATLTVNGSPASSGAVVNVPLNAGSNEITIVVTAQNGTTQTYQLNVCCVVPPKVNGVVQVSTAGELQYIDENQDSYRNSNIELMNDIDMSGLSWRPITGFSGTFNGNGYVLDNFHGGSMEGDDNGISFFESTASSGIVENMLFDNVNVAGEDYETVAVVVADNDGTVKGVGVLGGTVSSGEGENDGVLVANNNGTVEDSFSLANISGESNTVGDLVGSNSGSILDSYAAGVASGDSSTVGGLVAAGQGTVTNSYYNSDNSSSQGGTPLSSAQMKGQTSFVNWDFTNTWGISSSVNAGFPYLRPTALTGVTHQNVTRTGWTESWGPVPGAVSYNVYLNGSKVANTTEPTYDFTGKQSGTTYTVSITYVNNSNQESGHSSLDSITTEGYGGSVTPYISTASFNKNAKVGTTYSAQLATTGGTQPFRWSIVNGALPQGLTLNNQGVISGTPTGLGGQYTFTVQVTDANNLTATRQLTLTVDGPTSYPSIATTSLSPDTMGQPYDQMLNATGGTAPYKWSITHGALPPGLRLNSQTGEITGTTSKGGVSSITVLLTDANGMTKTRTLRIDILQSNQREIVWNGQIQNVPSVIGNDGGTKTTFVPIWYVMQLLKSMKIQSAWNGHDWNMTTSSTPDLSNIKAGKGSTSIFLNGKVVQKVNIKVQDDPSTNKPTTYMPIWYMEQIFNRIGLQSTWNGKMWTVIQQNK